MSVLLADGSASLRHTIRRHLQNDARIALLGEAASFSQAIRMTAELRPDVVVLDLHMKDDEGLDALAAGPVLKSAGAKIIAISLNIDEDAQRLAREIEAARIVEKMKLFDELVPAILEAQPGRMRYWKF